MTNQKIKDCYKKKTVKKEPVKNFTEELTHKEIFIANGSSKKYDSKKFITDSCAMSHIVTAEENMSKLHDTETRVSTGDSVTLNGIKRDNFHGYQKRDKKLHFVKIYDPSIIPGIRKKL